MMQFDSVPHFAEEGSRPTPSPRTLLPSDLYAQVLDSMVIACVDVLLTHREQVFLAKRKTYPHPSWWFIGGRMQLGESPITSAQRKVYEDANLQAIAAERFQYIGTHSTQFARRQQSPQENGLHTLNLTYHLTVSPEEMRQIQLNPAEYAEGKWVAEQAIASYLGDERVMHQALWQVIQSLSNRKRIE
jgi:ADP-ribose pyrophosphatase YjhB (NUDIX family)